MPPYFEVVLFDLGNTLIYFDDDWANVMVQANLALARYLRQKGYIPDDLQFAQAYADRMRAYYLERDIGLLEQTTESVLNSFLKDLGIQMSAAEIRRALDELYAVSEAHWQIEDDAYPTLAALQEQGYRLGLVSNAGDVQDVYNLLDKTNLHSFFEIVLVSAGVGVRKPHQRIFQIALSHWNIPAHRAVMVGDTLGADIAGAHGSGIASVWITRRVPSPDLPEDMIHPDRIISHLRQLPDLLNDWQR